MKPQTPTTKPKKARKWWVKLLRAVGFTVLGIIILYLILAGTLLVLRYLQSHTLKQQITQDIQQLSESRDTSGTQHQAALNLVTDTLNLANAPTYSTVSDICFVAEEGQKYTSNFLYQCMMVYVDLVQTPFPEDVKEEISNFMSAYGDRSNQVPNEANRTLKLYDGSLSLSPDRSIFRERLDNETTVNLFVKLPYQDTLYEEAARKSKVIIPSDIKTSLYWDDLASNLKLVSETYNGDIYPTKDYLIISTAHTYYKKDLGCAVPEILFCSEPLPANFLVTR